MNEFDRRILSVAQNHVDLAELAHSLGGTAIVEHFGYTLKIGSAADPISFGFPRSATLAMQSDAWFFLQYVSSCVMYPDSSFWFQDSGGIQLQVTDTGSGEVLYSTPSSAGSLTATISRAQPGAPLLLPIARILPPNTNIKVDITEIGVSSMGSDPVSFWLFFGGSRVAQV